MVGMGAMVGGGTGAAMTAVAMIFEMTRDYDIVLPMIIAVAFSLGTRRVLSPESIYTLKLVRRGHAIPNALHANMFLVQSADQVMETDVFVLDVQVPFRDVLTRLDGPAFRHVVVTKAHEIYGVLRINTGLRRAVSSGDSDITLGALAQRNFIVVQANDVAFGVISRLWRERAVMAVVVEQNQGVGPAPVLGVIAKEHIADAVATSIRIFPGEARRWRYRSGTSQAGESTRKTASGSRGKGASHETDT
jgi:CIC family chloride channel protein